MSKFNNFKLVCKKCGNEHVTILFKKDVVHYDDGKYKNDFDGVLVETTCICCDEKEIFTSILHKKNDNE